MENPIQLTFPCTKKWQDMPDIGEQLKFCADCSRCITDFTKLSADELQKEFKKAGGQTCGLYRADQLGNVYQQYSLNSFKKLSVSLLSLLGAFAAANTANAQSTDTQTPVVTESSSNQAIDTIKFPIQISGRLRDKKTLLVASGARVQVMQGDKVIKAVATNYKGEFEFVLNREELTDTTITLQVFFGINKLEKVEELTVSNDNHLTQASFDLKLSGIPTYYLLHDYNKLIEEPFKRKEQGYILGSANFTSQVPPSTNNNSLFFWEER